MPVVLLLTLLRSDGGAKEGAVPFPAGQGPALKNVVAAALAPRCWYWAVENRGPNEAFHRAPGQAFPPGPAPARVRPGDECDSGRHGRQSHDWV